MNKWAVRKTEVWRPLSHAAWVRNFLSSWRPVLHKTHSSPNLKFLLFGIKWCAEKAAFCITNRPQQQRQHKKTPASFTPIDSDSVLLHDGLLHQVTSGTKRGQGQNKANLSVHFGQRYNIRGAAIRLGSPRLFAGLSISRAGCRCFGFAPNLWDGCTRVTARVLETGPLVRQHIHLDGVSMLLMSCFHCCLKDIVLSLYSRKTDDFLAW